jgi:hypothetical protein
LSYAYIREKQQEDDALLAILNKYPDNYVYMDLDDDTEQIICYKKDPNRDDWKIPLPESLVPKVVRWFHQVLGHPGQTRLRDTLQARYHHPKMRSCIDQLVREDCQGHKLAGRGYGLLPEQEVCVTPWEEVAIDLIGPWKLKVGNKLCEFSALTSIDTASNLVELVRIDYKTVPLTTFSSSIWLVIAFANWP